MAGLKKGTPVRVIKNPSSWYHGPLVGELGFIDKVETETSVYLSILRPDGTCSGGGSFPVECLREDPEAAKAVARFNENCRRLGEELKARSRRKELHFKRIAEIHRLTPAVVRDILTELQDAEANDWH